MMGGKVLSGMMKIHLRISSMMRMNPRMGTQMGKGTGAGLGSLI
jgi:hypothetical protein